MKFKEGDTVQFIEKNQLVTGQITGINIFSTGNFNYSVDVNVGADIVSFRMVEDELALAKPLPVVPKFVADNIEWDKHGDKDIYESLECFYTCGDLDMKEWLIDGYNYETYCRAWLDGYEIEQEPLFIMPVPYSVLPVHYYINRLDEISFKQGNAQKFTWDEIEKYFPEIRKYAVKVEGVAE
ncbi:TPA_asm: DUF1642 domain-containing protein [Listeria monocytogenes]|nr:DUF1642 domain-containing protein [Listeria monocytogenes]